MLLRKMRSGVPFPVWEVRVAHAGSGAATLIEMAQRRIGSATVVRCE